MILDIGICQNTVKAWKVIGAIILVVKVLVPIIIIVTSVVPIFNSLVKGNADETIKSWKQIARKIAAGIIIFLIPGLVTAAINLFAKPTESDDLNICLECFDHPGSDECERYIKAFEDSEKEDVKRYKQEVPGGNLDTDSMSEEEKEDKQTQQQGTSQTSTGTDQTSTGTDQTSTGTELSGPQTSAGANNSSLKTFSASNGIIMQYYEILPDNVTDNMPLIIFLHGSGELNNAGGVGNLPIVSYVANEYSGKSFIFLAPVAPTYGWKDGNLVAAKEIIDSTISKYNVDKKHVIITGMSMGGHGTWNMLAAYGDFFSAGVPMSGCSYNTNIPNYVKVPILGIVGGQEGDFTSCMTGVINSINSNGGNARLDSKAGATHETIQSYYRDKELFNWMLSQ